MEVKKSKSPIINSSAAQNTATGKSELVKDEKAALVKPSGLPSFMQRKTVAISEEEKEKKLLTVQRLKMHQPAAVTYKDIDKK